MKKMLALSSVSLALIVSSIQAQAESLEQKWIGGFGMIYNDDKYKKQSDVGVYDDGSGFGLEAGFRFSNDWAIRTELTRLTLDYVPRSGSPSDDSGMLFGLDAMYFLPNDSMYLFGGIKRHSMDYTANFGTLGFGKHWAISDNWRLVTEVATLLDFGETLNDYTVKIGFAYMLGASSSQGKPMTKAAPVANERVDSDNDGVIDSLDACPQTVAGTVVDSRGCPVVTDQDNDGVNDTKDRCPDTPAADRVDQDGCTIFEEKQISFNLNVQFANNSSEISSPNSEEIKALVQFLKRYGKTSVEVEGHTSAPGSAEYNMWLSERRAEAFRDMLINTYGISAERVTAKGYGETQLLDSSNTAEAHRLNRRITVNIEDTVKVRLTK